MTGHGFVVGFVGDTRGLTDAQATTLPRLLADLTAAHPGVVFRHGVRVGADTEAHHRATLLGFATEGYPARVPADELSDVIPNVMAVSAPVGSSDLRILVGADVVVLCPRDMSGTGRVWDASRAATPLGIFVHVIVPDGEISTLFDMTTNDRKVK